MKAPISRYFEPPKELYDKFDEFLGLVLELNRRHKELYEPIVMRVAATIDSLVEEGGFRISSHGSSIFVALRLGPNKGDVVGDLQVLARTIRLTSSMDPMAGFRGAISLLQTYCDQLNAAKLPEPEVLITTPLSEGDTYKISAKWISWCQAALPYLSYEEIYRKGAARAAERHFQLDRTDRIEGVIEGRYSHDPQDVEVSFYRLSRVKL